MKTLQLSIIAILVIVFGSISPIWATSDLSVNLSESGASVPATFKFSESAFIEYPNGGKLKDLLAEKSYMINFTENSDNINIKDLMRQLNTALAHDQKSHVVISDLTVRYTASLVGDDKSASIYYNLELIPTLTNYVIKKRDSYENPTIIDAAWIGLAIKDPVIIKTVQYGDVEINIPNSFVKKVMPDVYSNIQGTKAEDTLKNNLIDTSGILQSPLNQWHSLFDPAFTISETSGFGYKGQRMAITVYTNLDPNGSQKPTQNTVNFSTDANYKLTIIQHASSATVNIEGSAKATSVGGMPVFATISQTYSSYNSPWWHNSFLIILIVIAGIEVVTVVVFFRRMNLMSDRKFAGICIASMGFSVVDCIVLGFLTAHVIGIYVSNVASIWDNASSILIALPWIGFAVLTKKNAASVYNILQHKNWKKIHVRTRTIINITLIIFSSIFWLFLIYELHHPSYGG